MSTNHNQPKDPRLSTNDKKVNKPVKAIFPKVNGKSPDHLTSKTLSQKTSPPLSELNPPAPSRKMNLAKKITLIIIATVVFFLWLIQPYVYLFMWPQG